MGMNLCGMGGDGDGVNLSLCSCVVKQLLRKYYKWYMLIFHWLGKLTYDHRCPLLLYPQVAYCSNVDLLYYFFMVIVHGISYVCFLTKLLD